MAKLLLGPLLRHVGERDATIWVETDAPGIVSVHAGGPHRHPNDPSGTGQTFTVAGHHYAIVVLDGLEPGRPTPYEVRLDGVIVWPEPDSKFPASRIRTIDPGKRVQILFGSCREPPSVRPLDKALDPDIFDAYAARMAKWPDADWPDVLLLVGDQVYADDTSPEVQDYIKGHRDITQPPMSEVANFEEYTRLYYESWGEPSVRWLLSTLPTSMIFDDHDVRDDWNTSQAWRDDMAKLGWWEERITGALMSYWIYQHLGNLSPARLAEDELLGRIRAEADAEQVLREFAQAADRETDGAKGTIWSYRRDFGDIRLVVVDSRCGRILADDRRSMLSEAEFGWVEQQTDDGSYDHLVVASSMPWLLPRALHDIESWNEALCAGSRGQRLARLGEKARRAVDLEHWAAFRKSFDRLAAWFAKVGSGEHAPATITVVSGDVHHTYVGEAHWPKRLASRVYQVTCSPIHNTIPFPMRLVFHLGWSRTVTRVVRIANRWAKVPPLPIHWHHPTGPHFGNMLALLVFEGREAKVVLERASTAPDTGDGGRGTKLAVVKELSLTAPPRQHAPKRPAAEA